MLAAERLETIAQRLSKHRKVEAEALASEFRVSEDTIRRDLRELASRGLCQKVYGGALAATATPRHVSDRRNSDLDRKQRLGEAASKLVQRGQFVFIDSGSTNLALAKHLPPNMNLTVATHDVAIASALSDRQDIELISIGGRVDSRTGSALGAQTTEALQKLRPDLLFLGVCAIDAANGISSFQIEDADAKTVLLTRSNEAVAIAMAEKISTVAPFHVGKTETLSKLITEASVPKAQLSAFKSLKIKIQQV